MSDLMIEVEGLTKNYGPTRAVDNVSFNVRRGEVLGFLGPNGAGKSTTMKMLTCFLAPTGGTGEGGGPRRVRRVARGAQAHRLPARRHADLPRHDRARVPAVRGRRCAAWSRDKIDGRIKEIGAALRPGRRRRQAGRRAVEGLPAARRAGAGDAARSRTSSSWTSRRAASTRTRSSRSGRSSRRSASEKTVILSTHILPEVQATCSRVVIISGGKLVADGTPDELRARERGGRYRVVVESNGVPKDAIRDRLASLAGVARCEADRRRGRLARVRHRRRRRRATCASRSSAPPSTTAGRCSSWRANRPAWKTCSATSPPERKASHEPGPRHLAARDPHLLQLAGRVHRRHRLHDASPATCSSRSCSSSSRPTCAASSAACRCCSCSWRRRSPCACWPTRRRRARWSCSSPCRCATGKWWSGKFLAAMALLCTALGLTLVFAITVRAARAARPRPGHRRLHRPPADGRRLRRDRRDDARRSRATRSWRSSSRSRSRSRCSCSARLTQFVPQSLQPLVAFLSIEQPLREHQPRRHRHRATSSTTCR